MSERDPGTRTTPSRKIYLEFIFFERARDQQRARPRENSEEWRCFVTKVVHFRFKACTELWARGLSFRFHNAQ